MPLAGAELVGVIPGVDVTGLDPDDDIAAADGLHIRGGFFRAFIPGYNAERGLGHALFDKARASPDLDRTQRGVRLGHQDGHPGVAAQVPGLDVLLLDPDVETAIPPLVVDRGEQDGAIRTQTAATLICGRFGDVAQLAQKDERGCAPPA